MEKNKLYFDQKETGNTMEKNKLCFDSFCQQTEALSIFQHLMQVINFRGQPVLDLDEEGP